MAKVFVAHRIWCPRGSEVVREGGREGRVLRVKSVEIHEVRRQKALDP